jgi:hypothetical protein
MRSLLTLVTGLGLITVGCATQQANLAPVMPKEAAPAPAKTVIGPTIIVEKGPLTLNLEGRGCRYRFPEAQIVIPATWRVVSCRNARQWRLEHRVSGASALLAFRWSRRTPAKLISRFKRSIKRRQGQILGHTGQHRGSLKSRLVFHIPKFRTGSLIGHIWATKMAKHRYGHIEVIAVWPVQQDSLLGDDLEPLLAGLR